MRIGIANERPLAAQTLRRALLLQPGHDVVWVAASGAEAAERCATETPDLVLMDVSMAANGSGMITRGIMARSPCAILIVADSVGASAASVFDAVCDGAFDAVDMPSDEPARLQESAAPLLAKIDTIARLMGDSAAGGLMRRVPHTRLGGGPDLLVAIGASAGGPAAVAAVLAELPKDFPGAIVIIQHVDEEFVPGMAGWLSERSARRVTVAAEGDRPASGGVLLAGAAGHLALTVAGTLCYTAEPRHTSYRPSVDVFFHSVSRHWRGEVVGVLLTGMGKDGALGLKALRDKGYHTVAQDEGSSAVYGMPKAAATLRAAVDILPLHRIAARLTEVAVRRPSRRVG